jgi:AcrR family transcriptional regulator
MAVGVSKVNRGGGGRATARGGAGRALTRDDIARAALAMVDEEGIDALSMRRLADRLGAGTMTLYGYFRSKEELLDAAVGAAAAEFAFTPPPGPLRDRLRTYVHAVRDVLERHPALPQLRGRQPILQPAAFGISEPGMRILLDAGFPSEEAARAFRVLFVHTFGSLLFGPHPPTPAEVRAARAALLTLPEDEFPAVTSAAEAIAVATGGHEQFDYGLELILDALEARAARLNASS